MDIFYLHTQNYNSKISLLTILFKYNFNKFTKLSTRVPNKGIGQFVHINTRFKPIIFATYS